MNFKKVKNIGIFAHVDAGKTTLTEQLLFNSGAITRLGRVDTGDTHTDTLELERERGISIMSAPISYNYNESKVNIIDTPGHVDFVAEVERVMGVLEGAILVVSAKEGVQSHTRLLYSALKRLSVPTIVFVNKIDRLGVDLDNVIQTIKSQLCRYAIPLAHVADAGTRFAKVGDVLDGELIVNEIVNTLTTIEIEECSALLETYLATLKCTKMQWVEALKAATLKCEALPIVFGSALVGEGISPCLEAIDQLLPCFEEQLSLDHCAESSPLEISGEAFKVVRNHVKTRQVYIKLTKGQLGLREMLGTDKVTRIEVLEHGSRAEVTRLCAGDIGILTGVTTLKVGESFGTIEDHSMVSKGVKLSKPQLSVQVHPVHGYERMKLLEALVVMADMDPYLSYELSELDDAITLRLFGLVQMEILTETLHRQYGIAVIFEEPRALYMEAPLAIGKARAKIYERYSFPAGLGFRVEPLPLGSGIEYVSEVTEGYLTRNFQRGAMEGALAYLDQGLSGWGITDMRIVLEESDFNSVDSSPCDFRNLAPLVVFEALAQVGTRLLWPISAFSIEVPIVFLGDVIKDLVKMRGVFDGPEIHQDTAVIRGRVPLELSMHYGLTLAHKTDGLGFVEFTQGGYEPIPESYEPVIRPYCRVHPTNQREYLTHKGAVIRQ